METKYPTETVEARNVIARAALDGDPRYSHEAIGEDDADINGLAAETGMPLVYRAESDSDVAVYSDGNRWAMVADANGPVVIRLARRIAWRVYRSPEGGDCEFCGEFAGLREAAAAAEAEPDGTPRWQWETHRAARDGVPTPDPAGVEDEEARSWHGESGWHCVTRVVYPAT